MNILKKFFAAIAKRTTNAPRTREFRTLEDFRGGTFFDAFADARHIREYFRKAVAVEEERNSHTTTD